MRATSLWNVTHVLAGFSRAHFHALRSSVTRRLRYGGRRSLTCAYRREASGGCIGIRLNAFRIGSAIFGRTQTWSRNGKNDSQAWGVTSKLGYPGKEAPNEHTRQGVLFR